MTMSKLGWGRDRVPVRDGRSCKNVLLRKIRKKLIAEAIPNTVLTTSQAILLDRCAFLTLHIHEMEQHALEVSGSSEHFHREYNAAVNTLAKNMDAIKRLGAAPAATPPTKRAKNQSDADTPSLADVLARMGAG